jgi:NAD(P)-dependent dehydrogenase (short-subunit alcohol dehydrogenase family)
MNKIALITGATSGFGTVIAHHLVKKGYTTIVFGRSQKKLDALVVELKNAVPKCKVDAILCDLASFRSVNSACEKVRAAYERIDLFILNAGVWNFEFRETEDGVEETLQVNLLSPIHIFHKLQNTLPKNGSSKVIFTSSGLHQGEINFSDIEYRAKFSGFNAYRQSKRGILLMTTLFSQQPDYKGISLYAVHPGVVNTRLGRNAGWFSRFIFRLIGTSKENGAKTHQYLIDTPSESLTSGAYYAKSRITKPSTGANDLPTGEKLLERIQSYFDDKNETVKVD